MATLKDIKRKYRLYESTELPMEIDVNSVSLPSYGDIVGSKPDELAYANEYWTRSPGIGKHRVICVNRRGYIEDDGNGSFFSFIAVRPVFHIQKNLYVRGFKRGDKVKLGNIQCIVLSPWMLLYNDKVITNQFDKSTNDYDKSEIKQFVQDEFGKYVGQQELTRE